MAAIGLALLALTALSACGGNGDDGNGNGGSASTPATSSGSGGGAVPTEAPTAAEAAPTTGSATEELFIISRDFDSIELNLAAGDVVSVTYSAVGASTGGITQGGGTGGEAEKAGPGVATGEVLFTVLDPLEDQILNVEQMASNTTEFQADIAGKYQMVFSNPYLLQGLIVTVDYTINP